MNEKVEGYFEVCQACGLTGKQRVMIPESNVPNLMLKDEVLQAVQEGKFHLWSVRTIDEGIEILTGVRAGQRLPDGGFEPESVHARVDQRLKEMAERFAEFSKSHRE